MKKVFLASDHAGFELKEALLAFLTERGFDVEDLGPKTFEKEDDYPDTIAPMALALAEHKGARGIAIGMSGQGEAMVLNRHAGIRSAVYYGKNPEVLKLSRQHNNANVLSLGAAFLTQDEAKQAVIEWLSTDFGGEERHVRRISKLGFTLIELIVVVAIIGVLASIISAGLLSSKSKARDAQRTDNLKSLQLAAENYIANAGVPPGTGAGWWAQVSNTCAGWQPDPYTQLRPEYFSTLPEDPLSPGPPPACAGADGYWYYYGRGYHYNGAGTLTNTGNSGDYVFCSKLESSGTPGYYTIPNPWGGWTLNYCVGN